MQDPATVGRSFLYNGASWTAINDLRIRSVVFTTGDLNPTITLASAAGTTSQTLCNISPITNIIYSTTGATGASFSGLPSGVTGTWASNLVTISGTPTELGIFNYTITLTGGCSAVTKTGTIALLTSSIHTTTVSACDHYTWNGIDYTSSGLYTGTTTNCITEKLDLTLTPFTYIWTGAASTVWNIPTNWSCGEVPGVSSDVTIAASTNPPVISSDITINTLTLNAGASLTVPSGFDLTVTNYIHNSGTLTVQNNANLIQVDEVTNSGNIIVNRNSAPIVRLDHTLWSSPVTGSQTLQQFSPNTLSNRFYNYTTSSNSYTATPATSTFEAGKGFAIRAPNAQPTPTANPFLGTAWSGTFNGVPNNGNITVALATNATNSNNYNLVGNPYPSAIDAKLLKESNPNMGTTLYFYQHTLTMNSSGLFDNGSTNYATWVYESTNPAGGTGVGASPGNGHSPNVTPTRTIQVGQGFIVKAVGNNMTFTNSMRSGSNNTASFMKNTTFESNRLWLNLQSGSGTSISDIIVGYVTGASNDIDQGYDGLSFGNTGSFLSSKIASIDYVIQGRSLPFDSNDIVPLGFTAETAGTYSISLTNKDGIFADTQNVFLKDDLTGITHDIKASAYDFASNSGTFDARFSLIYTSALANASTNFTPNSVVVFKPNQWFTINTNGIIMKDVLVYDMAGRLIFQQSDINANTTVLEGLSQTKGILLVKIVSNENEVVTVKVIN